jgi:hypothetical protein
MAPQKCVGCRENRSGCPENRSGCRIQPVRRQALTPPMPAGTSWLSPAMSPIGAHTTPAPTPRPAATSDQRHTVRAASCQVPPNPPAAAGRGHRFSGSHGPSEQKDKEAWLALRCHPKHHRDRLRPSHRPRCQECQRNPKAAGILRTRARGNSRCARRPARRRFTRAMRGAAARSCHCWPKNQRNPRAAAIKANSRYGRQPGARRPPAQKSILAPYEKAMLETPKEPRAAEIQVNPLWCRDERTR